MTPEPARAFPTDPDRVVLVSRTGESLTWGEISGQARALSETFPAAPNVMNLCVDRHAFIVTLLAAMIGGRTTLLPSDRTPPSMAALAGDYPRMFAVGDDESTCAGIEIRRFQPPGGTGIEPARLPEFNDDHPVAVMFTSGSTGKPAAHEKTWRFFTHGAAANNCCLMAGLDGPAGIVATVPAYHLYGFEMSVELPLLHGAIAFAGQPLFPGDIAAALRAVPEPRVLVSTPVHLRALVTSGVELPDCARFFSATAPLPESLAVEVEKRFGGAVWEIYGTTETGIVGWRRAARPESYRLAPGMRLSARRGASYLSAPHIDPPLELNDRLEADGPGRFRITGRSDDIVNIAGKRESLSRLNALLQGLDGVEDGAFLPPGDDARGPVGRMTAFVAAPGLSARDILAKLRGRLDSAFIPRRVIFVDALPRNAVGKLPAAELQRFAREHIKAPEPGAIVFEADRPFFAGHFPDAAIVPGVVLLDEALEYARTVTGRGTGAVEIVQAKFSAPVGPGEACSFRLEDIGDGRLRVECVRGDAVVMSVLFRLSEGAR